MEKDKIKYGNYTCKSSTFAYLCVTGIPEGILAAEVNGDLFCYDNNGSLRWKTDCLDLGHFIMMHYYEKKNMVCGILLNPRKKGDERMHLAVLDGKSGEIISMNSIETANYVFVESSESVLLVNGKGGMYAVNDIEIKRQAGLM